MSSIFAGPRFRRRPFCSDYSTDLPVCGELFGVGFALLLPRFFGLDGVLYSMPLSDILTFLIAGYLIYKTYHELNYHIALDSGGIGIETCAKTMESLV